MSEETQIPTENSVETVPTTETAILTPPANAQGVMMSRANLDEVFLVKSSSETATGERRAPRIDDYQIHLPCFEGPLDLLLHLIRKEQLNIYNIPVARVCENYLKYLDLMQQLDFNIAGEFMVMASTLIYLKSALLLPKDEMDPEEDPRKPLVAQLLEYEKFKKASEDFNQRYWLGRDVYGRPANSLADILPAESLLESPLESIDPFNLLKAFKAATDRTRKPPMEIATDPVSIKDKVVTITQFLKLDSILEFFRLLPPKVVKQEIILSFLAVLELAKLKFVDIVTTENFGPIRIRAKRSLEDLNMGMLDQY